MTKMKREEMKRKKVVTSIIVVYVLCTLYLFLHNSPSHKSLPMKLTCCQQTELTSHFPPILFYSTLSSSFVFSPLLFHLLYSHFSPLLLHSATDEDQQQSSGGGGAGEATVGKILDLTESDLVNLRRTLYLTIMSSVSFEECAHKITRLKIPDGYELELCNMLGESQYLQILTPRWDITDVLFTVC